MNAASDDGRIVSLNVEQPGDVALGDRAVFLADATPLASGAIFAHTSRFAAVRIEWGEPLTLARFDAVIVPRRPGPRLRERLPPGAAIWCRFAEWLEPGRTCRIDAGATDGFRKADRLFVIRSGLPIATLDITAVRDDVAEAHCSPLVANAAPEPGDLVRLTHSAAARRTGRLRSTILQVLPAGDDQEVWFPLHPNDGAKPGDRWVVREGDQYVALVILREFRGPFAIGTAIAACSRRPVRVADPVFRRDARDVQAGRAPLRIFRIEDDYCLVNAGEEDRIERDQQLYVQRARRRIATLTVTTVKIDFCGARIDRESVAPDEAPVTIGDAVFTVPSSDADRTVGRLRALTADNRVALLTPATAPDALAPGTLLEFPSNAGLALGILLAADGHTAAVYLPELTAPLPPAGGTTFSHLAE